MARHKLFDPDATTPFALSRSKVDLFLQCPRCFYLDRRLGIARPAGFPFNLNSAVDALLKTEFDRYRREGKPHPLMVEAGINAVPAPHPLLDTWRENFKGVRTVHEPTGFELFGAIDDLWRDLDTDELIVVDYKATSKATEVTLNADWQIGYKRQMEFYQWLLRQRGESRGQARVVRLLQRAKGSSRFRRQAGVHDQADSLRRRRRLDRGRAGRNQGDARRARPALHQRRVRVLHVRLSRRGRGARCRIIRDPVFIP